MHYGRNWGFSSAITPTVRYLILVNSGIFVISLLFHPKWAAILGLAPASFWGGYIWQPVTYMFLHGGVFHLFFNMLVLWMFGAALESTWGSQRFLKFYFICGIGAGFLNAVITPASAVPIVGASGAIYGLLMAFGILFPDQLIYFWGIFPIRAKYFVIGIGVIEFLTAMSASQRGIAHLAHLGGMLFGLVYMKWGDWRTSVSGWRYEKRRRRHLRVVRAGELEKEKLQKQVDALLDKIGRSGVDSLTAKEHELLKQAGEKMAELEDKE